MPESAPVYDEIAQVRDFPQLSACIASSKGCQCFTQQGTPLAVEDKVCLNFLVHGAFDPYRLPPAQQAAGDAVAAADAKDDRSKGNANEKGRADGDVLSVRQSRARRREDLPAKPDDSPTHKQAPINLPPVAGMLREASGALERAGGNGVQLLQ